MGAPPLYVPKAFSIVEGEMFDLVDSIAVGHVATYADGHIASSFVPVIVDRDAAVVRGHLSRGNQHWRAIEEGSECLVSVGGVDAYISPSYYPTKADTGEVVPTWNYELVQIRGPIRVIDDRLVVEKIVRSLTDKHERTFANPWSIDDAPRPYIEKMLAAIVGFEIEISEVSGKRKLSQNRPDQDRVGVIDGLSRGTRSQQQAASVTPKPDTTL
jgi:transcriptional regulator